MQPVATVNRGSSPAAGAASRSVSAAIQLARLEPVGPDRPRGAARSEPTRAQALQRPRAPTPARTPRSLLVPRTGLSDIQLLDVEDTRLTGRNARFDVPVVAASAATGAQRLTVTADYDNVLMPDGTEVFRGRGSLTLIVRNREVVGVLEGSVSFRADTVFVRREQGLRLTTGQAVQLLGGGLLTQGDGVIGLAPQSMAEVAGLRVSSDVTSVSVALPEPNRFDVGEGATIIATPRDRSVRVVGQQVHFRTPQASLDLANGSVLVGSSGVVQVELGSARRIRVLDDPAPATRHLDELRQGQYVRRRAERGQLFIDGISASDFDQGATGDCWFIGTVLAIAALRPELLTRLFTDNGDNTFSVRIFIDGKWRTMTVDDDFLHHARGGMAGPLYAASRNPLELWGPLLEKAHAATRANGYEGMWAGGFPVDAFRELTGLDSKVTQHNAITDERLFAQIARNVVNRVPMASVAGVPYRDEADEKRLDAALEARNGLRNWHVYAVVGTQTENGERFVVLRNTAGKPEFRSSGYTTDVTVDGSQRDDDGYFRMRIDDFRREFAQTTTLAL